MENKKAVAVENAAEDTIDLLEIFRALYRRWVWIVFVALVFGIALGMYGKFVVKDVFQAEASMCIIDSNKEVSMSDLQVGSALTNDYEGIIKSRVVLTKVISNLNLDIAYKNLYNAVFVDNPEATRIIRIRVVSGNKEEAVDIANEILSVSIEEIPHVLGSNTPPVGVVGDAAIVSSVCDGTLLVIENGVTKKKTLCQIAAELEKVDTNILGVVQNMVGSKKDSSYYGKGNYGYYYGNNQNKK